MKNWIRNQRGLLAFLLLFGLFRTAVADWNAIPSGSMHPNLLEGDVVFVNRLAYQLKLPLTDIIVMPLGEPKRGDIVTFSSPADGTRLIKRVIALPGDSVALRDKQLFINGQQAQYLKEEEIVEALGDGVQAPGLRVKENIGNEQRDIQWLTAATRAASFGPIVVPADHFLMLGDNRDNSADSRYFGFVPRRLLIGRAERILVSAAIKDNWQLRFDRFGRTLR
ncbi:MAG: signal peptidase I [Gammaproteobacteria bacterium]|nr:signal peptidase I [Gammaproteobacteria bacterium]